jgi:hypothetical protein
MHVALARFLRAEERGGGVGTHTPTHSRGEVYSKQQAMRKGACVCDVGCRGGG